MRCRAAGIPSSQPVCLSRAKLPLHGVLAQVLRQAPVRRIATAPVPRWTWRQYLAVAATVLLGFVISFAAFAGLESHRQPPEFADDFTAGLAEWEGQDVGSWTIDRKGFARPGRLALFGPSRGLGDYRLEFHALVETKSMGCVFRAAAPGNYHVDLLSRTKPGYITMERFSVIAGKPEPHKRIAATIKNKGKDAFGITLLAKGAEFTLYANDEQVDHWFDGRLLEGGAGFFSEPGGRSRLYGVQLTAQGGLAEKLRHLVASSRTVPLEED